MILLNHESTMKKALQPRHRGHFFHPLGV